MVVSDCSCSACVCHRRPEGLHRDEQFLYQKLLEEEKEIEKEIVREVARGDKPYLLY